MRPTIVCLCGSSRFKQAFIDANRSQTLLGKIVLSIGMFGHEEGIDMEGPLKKMLDRLHFDKIDLADEVMVLNVDGYVGSSTFNEIKHAIAGGKDLSWLEIPSPELQERLGLNDAAKAESRSGD